MDIQASPGRNSYRQAFRQLASPARLRESLSVTRPLSLRNAAIAGAQAALAVVAVATLLHLSPWSSLAGFGSLGALAALFGRFAPLAHRRRIVLTAGAMLVAPVALLSLMAFTGLTAVPMLIALAIAAGVLLSLAHRWQMGPPGAVIFIFAASAALAPVDGAAALAARSVATALGVAAAWLACLLTDRCRDATVALPAPSNPSTVPAGSRPSVPVTPGYAVPQAVRVALCAAVSALAAHAAGWSHPAWAAIGAIAVLQGAHLPGTAHRAWQRTLGTLAGALIAWWILAASPNFWMLLLAVVVLQVATESVIGFNYALGQIFVTPMALLMTSLSSPGGPTDMAVARILDTALGAAVGTGMALALSSLDERLHLARHHSGQRP